MTSLVPQNTKHDQKMVNLLRLAKRNQLEAQRLAMDCARMLSFTTDQIEQIRDQGFFKRIANKFTGKSRETDLITKDNLTLMQEMSFRYMELLNENDLLLFDSVITLKNQLSYLKIENDKTKAVINEFVQYVANRFDEIETRIERLETTSAIHGWLLTIEEYNYNRFPIYIRLLKIVSDFRKLKPSGWTIPDIRCLRSALRKTNIDPDKKIVLRDFIKSIAIENYPGNYNAEINGVLLSNDVNIQKVEHQISLPVLISMYKFADKYVEQSGVIQRLAKQFPDIPPEDTAADLILEIIEEANIDLNTNTEHEHLALEFLSGVNMARYFSFKDGYVCINEHCIIAKQKNRYSSPGFCTECGEQLQLAE